MFKVGDYIEPKSGTFKLFEQARVVAKHIDSAWIIEVTKPLPSAVAMEDYQVGSLHTRATLDRWYQESSDFFVPGKAYRYAGRDGSFNTFYIDEIRVGKLRDKRMLFAVAKRVGDNEIWVMLDAGHFEKMEEV